MAKKTSPPFFDALHFIHCLLDWWRGRTSLSPSYETVHHMTMVWLAPTAELQLLLFSIFTISSSAPDDPGMPKWKGKKWQHMTPRTPQWGEKLEVDGDRHCRSKKKLRIWGEFCCIISMLNANASFLFEFYWQEVCSLPVGSVNISDECFYLRRALVWIVSFLISWEKVPYCSFQIVATAHLGE